MNICVKFYIRIFGKFRGKDKYKNSYYSFRSKNNFNQEKRMVIYKGKVEASKVPPSFEAWLRNLVDSPLPNETLFWQKPHLPNLTGSIFAYYYKWKKNAKSYTSWSGK